MTPDEMCIEVAELRGFTDFSVEKGVLHGRLKKQPDDWDEYMPVPDYPNDLNAVAEVEARLPEEQAAEYMRNLWDVVSPNCKSYIRLAAFCMKTATAAQCCEALLRTAGKWRGE